MSAPEALESFRRIISSGAKPTRFLLCTALNSCAKTLSWQLGLQIHVYMIKYGYEENLILSSALVDLYAKCGAMLDARSVFDGMKRHDQVSWTSIISGFSQNGHGREAISMFKGMSTTHIKPNCYTYVGVISACTCLDDAFAQVIMFHVHVLKLGFNTNSFVVSALIDCYSKHGRIDLARLVFDEAIQRDNILLNSMISGYSQNSLGEEAVKLFVEMRNENLRPTDHTLSSILNSCGSLTALQLGRQVYSLVTKMGSENNEFVASALIDMYSKCGHLVEARVIFDQTPVRNDVLWTSMIMGYAQSGKGSEALELFERLVTVEGYVPDKICFTAVLTACNHAGLLDKGVEYFNMMRDYGLVPDLDQYACLIDLYARNGHLKRARELMKNMPFKPNYVMWTSFLSSCKIYGEVELGKEAANELLKMEPGNAAPYVLLANIYATAGLWTDVVKVRKLMQQKGLRKSAGWSWVEVEKGVHIFSVGDAIHPQSQEIYDELGKLHLEVKEVGYMPKHLQELEDLACE
ncbi:pentatricopeptide repeat-containing protein At3g02330, mitochondrial-like [Mangifera indica]|uniref:pentatricopeptide repeat-containing protein At3g02330, mitochondrial-like n=1 Tax=Mangifera indica TaxID=29780 RepID=UPI001CF9C491|nr:pentatricopeptide repeat-containing protein At3g02330, mitochondrial-like [Mangifera indica]